MNRIITAACGVVLTVALTAGYVSLGAASDKDRRPLHITKECSKFTGQPGSFCTIVASNVPQIPKGTTVFYDQANGIPTGLLDSNVALHTTGGNWAVGRCTVDHSTRIGVCTFSDGIGTLAGFHGRATVTVDPSAGLIHWDGTYELEPEEN